MMDEIVDQELEMDQSAYEMYHQAQTSNSIIISNFNYNLLYDFL